jgi:aspartate racemase
MQSDFYPKRLNAMGIEVVVPSETHQDEIEAIIFGELVVNIEATRPKQRLLAIIANYEVDGIILGCTELPLIMGQDDVVLPVIDTMELHVEAALKFSPHD